MIRRILWYVLLVKSQKENGFTDSHRFLWTLSGKVSHLSLEEARLEMWQQGWLSWQTKEQA